MGKMKNLRGIYIEFSDLSDDPGIYNFYFTEITVVLPFSHVAILNRVYKKGY